MVVCATLSAYHTQSSPAAAIKAASEPAKLGGGLVILCDGLVTDQAVREVSTCRLEYWMVMTVLMPSKVSGTRRAARSHMQYQDSLDDVGYEVVDGCIVGEMKDDLLSPDKEESTYQDPGTFLN